MTISKLSLGVHSCRSGLPKTPIDRFPMPSCTAARTNNLITDPDLLEQDFPANTTSSTVLGKLWDGTTGILAIGGHRGMGENVVERAGPASQYRENTIRSFREAVRLGASFVEFDVQVTRDGVPVIWHDDVEVYGNSSTLQQRLIADLTLVEFKALLQGQHQLYRQNKFVRQQHLPWTCGIENELPTLTELFAELPKDVGFDIEVKMTTPDTVTATSSLEVNRVVQPILKIVQQCAQDGVRPIVFSSFDPEVCVALRQGQSKFPVLFLSGGGAYEHVDPRRTSIPAAIEFASISRLQGIVLETAILRSKAEYILQARSKGLQIYTYGQENNDANWLRQQYALGVQGAIVDSVSEVVLALTSASYSA